MSDVSGIPAAVVIPVDETPADPEPETVVVVAVDASETPAEEPAQSQPEIAREIELHERVALLEARMEEVAAMAGTAQVQAEIAEIENEILQEEVAEVPEVAEEAAEEAVDEIMDEPPASHGPGFLFRSREDWRKMRENR